MTDTALSRRVQRKLARAKRRGYTAAMVDGALYELPRYPPGADWRQCEPTDEETEESAMRDFPYEDRDLRDWPHDDHDEDEREPEPWPEDADDETPPDYGPPGTGAVVTEWPE